MLQDHSFLYFLICFLQYFGTRHVTGAKKILFYFFAFAPYRLPEGKGAVGKGKVSAYGLQNERVSVVADPCVRVHDLCHFLGTLQVVQDLSSVVGKPKLLDLALICISKDLGKLMMTRFHNENVTAILRIDIHFLRIPHVTRKDDALSFCLDEEGIGMEALTAVLLQVGIVACVDPNIFILKKESVSDLMLSDLCLVGGVIQLTSGGFYRVKNIQFGNENVIGIVVNVKLFIDLRQLIDHEQKIGQAADVVDVHV